MVWENVLGLTLRSKRMKTWSHTIDSSRRSAAPHFNDLFFVFAKSFCWDEGFSIQVNAQVLVRCSMMDVRCSLFVAFKDGESGSGAILCFVWFALVFSARDRRSLALPWTTLRITSFRLFQHDKMKMARKRRMHRGTKQGCFEKSNRSLPRECVSEHWAVRVIEWANSHELTSRFLAVLNHCVMDPGFVSF